MHVFIRPLRRLGAFTLIELLTVMAVIAVLAGLILSISGFVTHKAATARAQSEIGALSLACENYKTDNGAYPSLVPPTGPGASTTGSSIINVSQDQSNVPSDNLDPRSMGKPSNNNYTGATAQGTQVGYTAASLELYVALTGDVSLSGTGGGQGTKNYISDFRQDAYGRAYTNASVSGTNPVQYLGDPFGNPYGYSTANAFFQQYAQTVAAPTQPTIHTSTGQPPGYNPTFDIWSTAGQNSDPYTGGGSTAPGSPGDPALSWVKSWQ
jgi:prepilin-type N-terminal cleavage/methylation domain-containing protein